MYCCCVVLDSPSRYGEALASYDVPANREFDWVRAHSPDACLAELEVERASLNAAGSISPSISEALFCVRSPEFLEHVPTDVMPVFKNGSTRRVAGTTVFRGKPKREKQLSDLIARVRAVPVVLSLLFSPVPGVHRLHKLVKNVRIVPWSTPHTHAPTRPAQRIPFLKQPHLRHGKMR